MIVEDTLITVTADQAERRVQDLRIADRIFNPFTRDHDEIVDILSRTVVPGSRAAASLWPKVIPAGSLAPGRPRRDLILSPAQIVMTLRPAAPLPGAAQGGGLSDMAPPSVPAVVERRVDTLTNIAKAADKPVRYFAIFFDFPRFLDTSGVLTRAFTLEDVSRVRAG